MSRISRKCTESKYYHVMVQGINKENIFEKNDMKNKYRDLIAKKSKENQILILAYCIMNNHVHLLIKTESSEALSKMMSQMNTGYGKYYNKKINRTGYVFRDRYRAEPIHDENHLRNCLRYIHENPVKAHIVQFCEEYIYSSFNDYKNNCVNSEIVKAIFGDGNYLDKISGEYEDYNFIEVNNEFGSQILENFDSVCDEYSDYDYSDERNVYINSKELKKRTNATNEQIMKFMGIKRATYYNIMKRQKNLDF